MRLREHNPARSTNRSNALLVELLIVVMFFMLSATVLLQVFAAARNQSRQAERMIGALNTAQNVADELYAAEDAGGRLKADTICPSFMVNSRIYDQYSASSDILSAMISRAPFIASSVVVTSFSSDR